MNLLMHSRAVLVACVVAASATAPAAQSAPETFSATASVKKGAVSATAPVRLTISRYATDKDREAAKLALRNGGTESLRAMLAKLDDAGFIQIGERRTAVKFVGSRATSGGKLVTMVTAEPIAFLGAGVPASKPRAGYDVAVAIVEVLDGGGQGTGDLSPAARVGLDEEGALLIEDYGSTVVWLNGVTRVK